MARTSTYLNFNRNTEEAFNFYKSIFGGEFITISRFKDFPNPENPNANTEAEKIMHIALSIGSNSILMGSDTPAFLGTHNLNENRSKISVSVDSKEEADKIFNGLSDTVDPEMPIGNSPWGSYFGMVRDKYGIEWMVNFEINNNNNQ